MDNVAIPDTVLRYLRLGGSTAAAHLTQVAEDAIASAVSSTTPPAEQFAASAAVATNSANATGFALLATAAGIAAESASISNEDKAATKNYSAHQTSLHEEFDSEWANINVPSLRENLYEKTSLYRRDDDRHNNKKKALHRGKMHRESCFAGLRSGKKKQRDHSPFGTNNYSTSSNYDDPLDVVMEQQQQGTGRHSSRRSFSKISLTQKMGNTMMKESKEHASSQDVIIDLESTRNHDDEGSSGKKRKKSRYFDSFDSLNSSSSVKQGGDNGFYVDGDFDSSQGSGKCSDNVMAALDGANQRKAKRRKSPPQSEILSNFNLIRDPKKKDVGNRKMSKLPIYTASPRFKSVLRQKDPLVEDSDDDSVAGRYGERARWLKRNSSAFRISTNKERSQLRGRLVKDKELFKQPHKSHLGECPICFLPMPIDENKSSCFNCCCKSICNGCVYADYKSSGNINCPFCREPGVNGDEENDKILMKRVKANDPVALNYMGRKRIDEGDIDKGVEYLKKAVELGDIDSHFRLGGMYYEGEVVEKDLEKAIHHYEKAAIGGHPQARYNLGCFDGGNGNFERAVKHLIIAAEQGLEESMKLLRDFFSAGQISKEELESTLCKHKAAIDATKSAQRDEGEAYSRRIGI